MSTSQALLERFHLQMKLVEQEYKSVCLAIDRFPGSVAACSLQLALHSAKLNELAMQVADDAVDKADIPSFARSQAS